MQLSESKQPWLSTRTNDHANDNLKNKSQRKKQQKTKMENTDSSYRLRRNFLCLLYQNQNEPTTVNMNRNWRRWIQGSATKRNKQKAVKRRNTNWKQDGDTSVKAGHTLACVDLHRRRKKFGLAREKGGRLSGEVGKVRERWEPFS